MASEKDVCDRLTVVTGGLSTQFRVLATGVLAICGGLLIGNIQVASTLPAWVKQRLVYVAVFVVIAFAFDLLQLLFGYWDAWRKYKDINSQILFLRKEGRDPALASVEYDESSLIYRVQLGFFLLKLAVLLGSTLWLTVFMTVFLRQGPALGK